MRTPARRDPRQDPEPGDRLELGGLTYSVTGRDMFGVTYSVSGPSRCLSRTGVALGQWRRLMKRSALLEPVPPGR